MRFLVPICFFAFPALADTPMSAAEFEAHTQGKILTYGADGQNYGVEEYLPNRRVRWSFLDGKCKEGVWYQEGQHICFIYEDDFEPQCWLFFNENGRLSAIFPNGDTPTELYETQQTDEMLCLGPEVGV